MIKNAAGSNSIYNQNLSENALLIEFGGVDNTFEELNRSADALADAFSELYWQAEKVNQDVEQSTKKQ
jgi:stage II sporulation protein P